MRARSVLLVLKISGKTCVWLMMPLPAVSTPNRVPFNPVLLLPAAIAACVEPIRYTVRTLVSALLVVPMPRLPLLSNLAASTPPSVNAMVSAAGKKMPVLVSPVVVIDGAAAVPAEKVAMLETAKEVERRLVMVADAEVSVVMLAEVTLSPVILPLDAVMEPDADRLPDVEMFPSAVIVPEAKKLLTALEPAVNLPNAAEVDDKPVIVAEVLVSVVIVADVELN